MKMKWRLKMAQTLKKWIIRNLFEMLLKRIVEKQLKNFGLPLFVAYTLIEHRELWKVWWKMLWSVVSLFSNKWNY